MLERAGGTIDILKLDCEGAEWGLFSAPTLWHNVRWLTMEYHLWAKKGSTHDDMPGVVQRLGFEVLSQAPDQQWGVAAHAKALLAIRDAG